MATEIVFVFDEHDRRAAFGGRDRRGQSGRAATGHHHAQFRCGKIADHVPPGRPERRLFDALAVPDLEADFEAGKTYYIGLDHSSKNFNDWRLVIWKVEPEEEALGG